VRVGFTYDLRDDYLRQGFSEEETAEFDAPETIDAIEAALVSLGHSVERIGGIASLTRELAAGHRWDLVFNYAEGLAGFAREAQVPALLDAFQIPYTFSDGLVMALTLHKGFTKHVVRDLGVPTADFVVVSSEADAEAVRLPYPLFVKPVATGSSIGISAASCVNDAASLTATCRDLLRKFQQPVLVETFLPGRELTVGIIGTGVRARALGVMEVLFSDGAEAHGYSYANKKQYLDVIRYRLADDEAAREATRIALRVWNGLGCRDSGRVDCRCDADGRVKFMEVNPIAGLHPVHSDLVILSRLLELPYRQLLEWIMESASERMAVRGALSAAAAPSCRVRP
jgi:D-alanine-D-alanine ligase